MSQDELFELLANMEEDLDLLESMLDVAIMALHSEIGDNTDAMDGHLMVARRLVLEQDRRVKDLISSGEYRLLCAEGGGAA